MNKQAAVKRENWVDNVKVIACMLVVLGHFFQSMVKANIISQNYLYEWFNTTIYYFHVPLFFVCSGYLYQKYSRVTSIKSWFKNIQKKILVLGVPYVTFSTATWVLKKVFSGDVNDQIGGLVETLLFHPAAPYWYLYTLLFIFILTPTFKGKKMALSGLVIALIAYFGRLSGIGTNVYALSTVFSNEIWFVSGMCICAFGVSLKDKNVIAVISGVLFISLSVVVYILNIQAFAVTFVLGALACIAIIIMVGYFDGNNSKIMNFFANYTMPIFLMHTLFAAPLRVGLLKIGVINVVIHIIFGLGISLFGPIVAAEIMRKSKWLEFFLYPNKLLTSNLNQQKKDGR